MTQFLPPNLLALFAPRDPLPYLPPTDKLTHEKKRIPYSGVSDYLHYFEDPDETPAPVHVETRQEREERHLREKLEQAAYKLEQNLAIWDPQNNPEATSNPYKTLFVGRINYDTTESKLKREFEAYGKIKQIKIVHDINTGKPRGYAFIEYEDESSMHAAYKRADGKKIDGRRVVVDIERGRTIEGWKPRRLGGGKGGLKRQAVVKNYDTTLDEMPDLNVIRDRDRDRDRERDRRPSSKDRERKRSRDRDRKSRSRSRERKRKSRSRSKDRERSKKIRRSKSRDRNTNPKKRSRSRERVNREEHVGVRSNGNDRNNFEKDDNGFNNY